MTRRDSPSGRCDTTSAFVTWSIATMTAEVTNSNTTTRRERTVVSTERIIWARLSHAGRSARALVDLFAVQAERRIRQRQQPRLRDRVPAVLADPIRPAVDRVNGVVDLVQQVADVVYDRELFLALEREASRVRVLLVEGNLAGHLRLRDVERTFFQVA